MLRTFGIEMVLQATWIAAVINLVIAASNTPIVRRSRPYHIAITILTSIHALALALAFAICEAARGSAPPLGQLGTTAGSFVLAWLPVAIAVAVASARRSWLIGGVLAGSLAVAATLSIPACTGSWSPSGLAATIASLLSATALARMYCQQKI